MSIPFKQKNNNMTKRFKYYLHDNADHRERIANIEEQTGPLTEHQRETIGRPFYEIGLDCEINDNGDVKILGVIPSK
jgi:hypothetical protein